MSVLSRSEALQDAYESQHPYIADVACACGATWTTLFCNGEPFYEDALACEDCGGVGELA